MGEKSDSKPEMRNACRPAKGWRFPCTGKTLPHSSFGTFEGYVEKLSSHQVGIPLNLLEVNWEFDRPPVSQQWMVREGRRCEQQERRRRHRPSTSCTSKMRRIRSFFIPFRRLDLACCSWAQLPEDAKCNTWHTTKSAATPRNCMNSTEFRWDS